MLPIKFRFIWLGSFVGWEWFLCPSIKKEKPRLVRLFTFVLYLVLISFCKFFHDLVVFLPGIDHYHTLVPCLFTIYPTVISPTFYKNFMTYYHHFTAKKHRPRSFRAKNLCAYCISWLFYNVKKLKKNKCQIFISSLTIIIL
jgi:hypothetical protein